MMYIELIISYLKIGFFGFGGGYAMLSFIHHEVVVKHAWITAAEFADIIAISQMTPGPIAINSATYIGYTVGGLFGAIIATVAVCTPAMTLMVLITRWFFYLRDNRYVDNIVRALHPVVIAMIAAAGLALIIPGDDSANSFVDVWSWVLFVVAFIATASKMSLLIIIASLSLDFDIWV